MRLLRIWFVCAWSLATASAACVGDNQVSTDAGDATASDAVNDVSGDVAAGDAKADANDAGHVCVGAFGTPTPITSLNTTSSDYGGRFTADLLSMYLSSFGTDGGVGGLDIYLSTRATLAAQFGAPSLVPIINSATDDFMPTLTADGLTVYFASTRTGTVGSVDIFVASRSSTAASFGTPSDVGVINDVADDRDPYVRGDGKVLYFASARAGGAGSFDLYTTTLGTSSFGAPVAVAGVNSAGSETAPVISADELTIYFDSTRSGGQGGADIWVAHRALATDAFGTPVAITELNSSSDEFPTDVSPDGCTMIFSTSRGGGDASLNFDIWQATRTN